MTKEEALIIAEQNQSREIILKAIEKEKCELMGIIQGKDKAIKDLEWQLKQVTEDNDYYQAENERLEKENAELKELNEALTNENDEMIKGLGCKTCQIHTKFVELNNRITELENKNNDLKNKLKAGKDINVSTKAKEIIKRLMDIINHDLKCFDTMAGLDIKQKAEQFLKENSTYERIQKAKYNYTD